LSLSSVFSTANAAVNWETINPNIQFLKQQNKLRFYDSNQVLIEGEKCALLVDASGNFAAVEQLVNDLKKRLKTPLCYLVATHYHDDHLLGMAVIQHFYPDAELIIHQQVKNDFALYQKAFTDKLDGYEKSIELSYQRLANLPNKEQTQWREKLQLAKERLFRWREYQLNAPQITVDKNKTLDLGGLKLTLNAHKAHTRGDLTITTNNGRILIGGDTVDWLPYPGHGELKSWQTLLEQYINDPKLTLIIPGHGNTLDKTQLKQPLSFLAAITTHVKNNSEQTIEQLMLSFPESVMKPYRQTMLDTKSSNLFLQAGLAQAKKQNN
jgi:glyoxylase-like metal-dependent hydrolase (beta-lactamase superfamily II)